MHAPASHRLNFQFMRALVEQIQHGKDPLFRFLETDHPLHRCGDAIIEGYHMFRASVALLVDVSVLASPVAERHCV